MKSRLKKHGLRKIEKADKTKAEVDGGIWMASGWKDEKRTRDQTITH